MAPSHLPPEVAGLIFNKVELVRDKLTFLAVCSSWRSSAVKGVHTLVLTNSEEATPAAIASLLSQFHHQHRAAPGASPACDIHSSSSTLTRIALHTGSFTHVSRDLLRDISRHTNLRSLAIGVEANVLVALEDAPTADDYEHLFAQCVRLQDVRFAGSLVQRKGSPPRSKAIEMDTVGNQSCSPRLVEKLQRAYQRPENPSPAELSVPFGKPNVPRSLCQLQSLSHLHIGPNVFGSHSLTIVAQLPALTSLTIPVDLGLPPSAFYSLTGLRSLELQLNGRDIVFRRLSFPSSFGHLTRLKLLGLFGVLDYIWLDFEHAPANLETLRLDGWVGDHRPRLTNLTHLTALTQLDVRQSPGVVIPRDELLSLCLQVLDVDFFSLQLNGGGSGGGEEGEEAAGVRAVLPPSLLCLRIGRLPFDKCPTLAFHLRSYLQSLEVLHLTDVGPPLHIARRDVQFAPGAFSLPPLPKLVELHISCRFSLLDQGDTVGLDEKFPALRQLELIECGCYESFDVHSAENASIINGALAHPCLTHLTLAGFHFSAMPPLCSCPNACEIHLFDWEKQQPQEQQQHQLMQQAAECIMPGSPNLKQLSLHGFKAATVTFRVPLAHLKSLNLVGCQNLCNVQPEGKALAALFPRLGRIDVRDCRSWEGISH